MLIGLFENEKRFPQHEMSERWPISFFLCSDSGDGRYLKTLLVLMATAQNELLGSYRDLICEDDSKNTIALPKKKCIDLERSDTISYTASEDFEPLVYRYAEFSLRAAKGSSMTYNFDRVERAVVERVCCNKCVIDTASIPMYRYRDEIRGTDRFFNLSRKIRQVSKNLFVYSSITIVK